jgi:uncharacterized protein YraI
LYNKHSSELIERLCFMKRLIVVMLLLLGLVNIAQAQASNLLQNGNFEETQYNQYASAPDGAAFYNVPIGWAGGVVNSPGPQPWINVMPNGYPHTGGLVLGGSRSYHVSRGGGTFTAWINQTVATVPNTLLDGGVFAYMEKGGGDSLVRVGIDPTGGSNPFASSVVWGNYTGSLYVWNRITVTTTARANSATFFIFMTQNSPGDPNDIYLDEAWLNGLGAGSIVPPPPVSPAPTGQVVTATTTVNVRTAPNRTAERIGRIFPGTNYNFLGREGDWILIDFNGQRGYVSAGFVTVGTGAASAPVATGVNFTAQFNVNLRSQPNINGGRIGRLPAGQSRPVIGRSADGQWVLLDNNAWVAVRFGTLSGDVNSVPVR